MPKKEKPRNTEKKLTPITVIIVAVALGFTGYLAAEIILNNQVHPIHWLGGLVGVVLGYFFGWWIFSKRGDIFGF
jgi:hypothetical protein